MNIAALISEAGAWVQSHVLTVPNAAQLGLVAVFGLTAALSQRRLKKWADGYLAARTLAPVTQRFLRTCAGLIGVAVFLGFVAFALAGFERFLPHHNTKLLAVSASLAGAWAVIRLSASAIANRPLARFIAWVAWGVAALNILGLLAPVIAMLDAAGLRVGTSRISLLSVIDGALLLAVLLWGALSLAAVITHHLESTRALTPRTQVLLDKVLRFSLVTAAAVVALSTVGVNFSALAVFTGALGVGIGIGLQHQVSNIISGLFLLLDRSVNPGDVIEVGNTYGKVREMSARYVGVVTRDNKELLIPNDTFVLNQVINWSHTDRTLRLEVKFGVSYDSDPHNVRELAKAAALRPERVSKTQEPVCHLTAFGDSSIDFVLRFWISDPENGVVNVKGEVLLALWDSFKANGVNIPFPHRYIIHANPRET